MYILVRIKDNVIVGCASNPVNVREASKQGHRVYEIDDADFKSEMLGQIISEMKVIE